MSQSSLPKKPNDKHPNQSASKGALVGILVYLFLAGAKLISAAFFHSATLHADGLNNLSDIISSLTIFIGLKIAKRPADDNHRFGHDKYEAISSFGVSLIMFFLGFNVINSGINSLIQEDYQTPSQETLWIGCFSAIILYLCYRYIKGLARANNSMGLLATARDMRNDILISLTSILSPFSSKLGLPFLDTLLAIIIGGLIIFSAYQIFSESTFVLSDGFSQELLKKYRQQILVHPQVRNIRAIRARVNGDHTYVDVAIEIDGHLSVIESHKITEEVEEILIYNFGVYDVDVHVEPYLP